MKVLFLGGVFDDSHNDEIISKTKTYVEYAANNFQKKIINGLKALDVELDVVSAPFLGAYPNAYSDIVFKGFNDSVEDKSGYQYVHFLNIWGIRNPSRALALKGAVKRFISSSDMHKLIIVYSPHTPLIHAANYAKQQDPKTMICLVVPDLPQYMNLADKVSPIYKFIKKYDLKAFLRENKTVDSYVILTKHMVTPLEIGERPYEIIEGIYQDARNWGEKNSESKRLTIVYTGKLDRCFGVMKLVKAFMQINNDDIRLLICGSGEENENVQKAARCDSRIEFRGQVSSEEARRAIVEGDILVNPRENDTEYTKYSFPSKVIDYLATGNPVIAYKLDGIPDKYEEFITFVEGDSVNNLSESLIKAINMSQQEIKEKAQKAQRYLTEEISEIQVARRIISMTMTGKI